MDITNEYIKSFNKSCKEYILNKNEDAAKELQRYLQLVIRECEGSVFDPDKREVTELLINLHGLFDEGCERFGQDWEGILWNGVLLLAEVSKYPSMRPLLTKTYDFTPLLTQILIVQEKTDNKLKLLQLLQELTYGIKLEWEEGHLGGLMSTLSSWAMKPESDSEIVVLSLSVIVNLAYRNLPALYTLLRTVDIKKFLKVVLKSHKDNPHTRVQVCKLLIALEGVTGGSLEGGGCDVAGFARWAGPTLCHALLTRHLALARHVVDFFNELLQNPNTSQILLSYDGYEGDIEELLGKAEGRSGGVEDCVMEWVTMIGGLVPSLQPRLASFALSRLSSSPNAFPLLQATLRSVQPSTIQLFNDHLQEMLSMLEVNNIKGQDELERTTSLVRLLTSALDIPEISPNIIKSLSPDILRNLFEPLINSNQNEGLDLFQQPLHTFYVEVLWMVIELANRETGWLLVYSALVQEERVLTLLATALSVGPSAVKTKVLALISTAGFSQDCFGMLSDKLCEVSREGGGSRGGGGKHLFDDTWCPPPPVRARYSASSLQSIDKLIQGYVLTLQNNKECGVCELLELYGLKEGGLMERVRIAESGQRSAEREARDLRRALGRSSLELRTAHLALHSAHKSVQAKATQLSALTSRLHSVQTQADETHNKYAQLVQNMKSKTKIVSEQNELIGKLREEVERKSKAIEEGEQTIADLKKNIALLEENLETSRQTIADDKKEIELKNTKIETLKKDIVNQSKAMNQLQASINDMNKELEEQRRMREIISELATGKRKLDK